MQLPILTFLGIAIILQILGFIWYGPLFGKKWGRIHNLPTPDGLSKEAYVALQKSMAPLYVLNFVLSIVTIVTLWLFMRILGASLLIPFIIWLGFIMPTEAGAVMWQGKKRKDAISMFLINLSFQFIVFMVSGILLALWA